MKGEADLGKKMDSNTLGLLTLRQHDGKTFHIQTTSQIPPKSTKAE